MGEIDLVIVAFLAGSFFTVCTMWFVNIFFTDEREELRLAIQQRRETLRLNVSKKQY